LSVSAEPYLTLYPVRDSTTGCYVAGP
jgi:hypothetical protein